MTVTVASLQAVLDLDKRKFEKDLKETDKGLDKARDSLKGFTSQTDKLADAMGQTFDKGRLGLSEIDQGAINAKGSLSTMMSALGGGAAAQAESTLSNVSASIERTGKSALATGNNFETIARSIGRSFDKVSLDAKNFGEDAQKAFKKTASGVDEIEDALRQLGNEAENAGDDLGSIGDSIGDAIPGLDKLKGLAGPGGILGALVGGGIALTTAAVSALMEVSGATNLIQARTGATGEELEALGDIAVDVWRNNWGDSIADATDAMIQAKQVTGQTGKELEETTIHALFFRDVMGVDIPESLRAVRSASIAFGEDTTKVFDIMTAMIQQAGDPAGDLADTLNEYSIIAAEAGFSLEEFGGALVAGVQAGIRNYDVAADAIKEFTIRIKDDSDTTRDALNRLLAATDESAQAYVDLGNELDETTAALEENEAALEKAEGAYEAQKKVVSDLESALSDARRELDELSRPNLKGMEEFDDKLFDLDQQSKRLQRALLDLEEDSPAFEETKRQLEEVNKEMDRVSLERDLTIEPQLRAIEKAAMEGREPIVSYEEALANVAAKKEEIAGLEEAYNTQQQALEPLANEYERLVDENERLIGLQADLKKQMEDMVTPADELLEALSRGDISEKDIMSMVIQRLKEVDDQVEQNTIGVALFGTKWEDATAQGILAMDPAITAMRDFEGATRAAEDAVSQGLGPAWSTFWRNIKGEAIEAMESWGKWLSETAANLPGLKNLDQPFRDFLTDFGSSPEVPGFQTGGVVPGPIGQPTLAVVHGGEEILTPEQRSGSGGVTVIIQGNIYGEAHLEEMVMQSFGQLNMALAGGAR